MPVDPVVILSVGLVAIVVVAIFVWMAARRSDAQLSSVRQEMQQSLASQVQLVTSQLNFLSESLTRELGHVRRELQTGVADSGKLASDAQREVAQRLQSSTDLLLQMSQKIGQVQQASESLSQATQTLQTVLGGAKTRGILGETALNRLLEDALPHSAYETQYRFPSTGAVVDAVVHSGDHILPIDSKFPLDAFRRLNEGGNGSEEARRDFSQAVRKHADSIAEKYILPGERTFDFALMFVPSEAVYYELLITEDSRGRLDDYCRGRRVFPVSPNTFYACLSAIAISLQGQKIAENAQHILASLTGLRKQLESFADVYERLGTHLRHAQQSYDEADGRLGRARNALEQMSQGALPETPPQALESASGK